jgi:hypothetical protein
MFMAYCVRCLWCVASDVYGVLRQMFMVCCVVSDVLSEQEMETGLNVKLKVVRVSFLSARHAEQLRSRHASVLRCLSFKACGLQQYW